MSGRAAQPFLPFSVGRAGFPGSRRLCLSLLASTPAGGPGAGRVGEGAEPEAGAPGLGCYAVSMAAASSDSTFTPHLEPIKVKSCRGGKKAAARGAGAGWGADSRRGARERSPGPATVAVRAELRAGSRFPASGAAAGIAGGGGRARQPL